MDFEKYQHVEKWGNEEVLNIELGKCYVFPKIDGTNGSIWFDNEIRCGSRNRKLEIDNDNAGFYNEIKKDIRFLDFFFAYPEFRLFGEWLVPHSLNTYRKDSWRKFYVFDVMKREDYLTYDEYKPILNSFGIDYIPCQKIVINGDYEKFTYELAQNNFLIEDGKGTGEGIVIKNYDFVNKYGRKTWAKIITSEFKEQHHKVMGAAITENIMVESQIVDKYVTLALVDKTYSKVSIDGWSSKKIPQLLHTVYYDLVREELWDALKEFKNPTVNFKTLQHFCTQKIKELKSELF